MNEPSKNEQELSAFCRRNVGMSASGATFSIQAYKTNVLIWRMFVTSSMKAAIHLGPNYLLEFGGLREFVLQRW